MKNLKKSISAILFLIILSVQAQFESKWEMNLQNDNHKETFRLSQTGNSVKGTLLSGGKLSATYNEATNKLTGYFRYNKKMYKFNAFFKNTNKKEILVGKYCACSGEPTKHISFIKKKTFTHNDWQQFQNEQQNASLTMQGTWSSDFGELRLHQNGKRITGDYRELGVINGTLNKNVVTGTFTNKGKTGKFRWILSKKSFTGKWAWGNNTLGGQWNGTLVNTAKPRLLNNKTSSSFMGVIKTDHDAEMFIKMQKKLGKTAKQTIKKLKQKGYKNVDKTVAFVKKHYQLNSQAMLKAMKDTGYSVLAIFKAVKYRYNTSANTLISTAKGLNYEVNDIANCLLKDYNFKQKAVLDLLLSNTYSYTSIGKVLDKVFNVNGYTAAKLMKSSKMEAKAIYSVLKTTYHSSYKTVAKISKDILHFNAYQTAYNLYKVYNLKANQVANAIYNDAKFGLDETVSAIMKIYHLGKDQILKFI